MSVSIPLLRRDHVHFSLMLDLLDRQANAFERGVKSAMPLISLALKYFRTYPRNVHHPKEDLIYSALRRHMVRGIDTLYNALEEHGELQRELAGISAAARALDDKDEAAVYAFCDLLRQFTARERRHIEMEEAHLYPAAVHMLTPAEWETISASCSSETDPVFREEVSDSFDRLIAEILMKDLASRESNA